MYFVLSENLKRNIIEIIDATIIHVPRVKPMKPQVLKLVKYDCKQIDKLKIIKQS